MQLSEFKKLNIPDNPGVYSFIKDGQVLYIGKATSLRERLRSYFSPDLINTRGRRISNMVAVADKIEFEQADSVLEAFIRETELIKKYQPITNSLAKDNKSFNYVVITDEDFPRVLVERGRNIEKNAVDFKDIRTKYIFGPYPFGSELREAMKILRKIFPYRDTCIPAVESVGLEGENISKTRQPRPCFNRSIGLCPGVCTGEISKKEYQKIINNIRLFFQGKKSKVIANLKKQMMLHAKKQEFELAELVKKTLYSIEHIKDVSMIKNNDSYNPDVKVATKDWQGQVATKQIRIESYDIAHMAGKDMVGVMCVMLDGEFNKSMYRKFIIKNYSSSNDTGALKEVLERRLKHTEWPMPDLIVIDGGQNQLNIANEVLIKHFSNLSDKNTNGLSGNNSADYDKGYDSYVEIYEDNYLLKNMPIVVSVVKDDKHKAREILISNLSKKFDNKYTDLTTKDKIISLNAETHRFAITFHKKKRDDRFLPGSKSSKRKG